MKDKYREIIIHIVACFFLLALAFIPFFQGKTSTFFNPLATQDFVKYLVLIGIFYLNYFVLVPNLYFKKWHFFYIFSIFLVYFIFRNISFEPSNDNSLSNNSFQKPPPEDSNFPHETPQKPPHFSPINDIFGEVNQRIFPFLGVIFFSLLLRTNKRWQETEKEKITAELSYLKAQINPHFLFNTLNSIYSLAIIKSDETPDAVIKLSGMMRYVLSDASADFVSLEKELTYICNYIELQKLRFSDAIHLDFTILGSINTQKIAPLILISFIENAFKHGINAEEDSDIKIKIDILEQQLKLYVFNKKVKTTISSEDESGIGMKNAKNRLELLYPSRHKLSIYDTKEEYLVELSISV